MDTLRYSLQVRLQRAMQPLVDPFRFRVPSLKEPATTMDTLCYSLQVRLQRAVQLLVVPFRFRDPSLKGPILDRAHIAKNLSP
jgi:hypothetical protein